MDSPLDISSDDNLDFVPLSIKVIVIWFYLLGLLSLGAIFSVESGRFVINAGNGILGFLLFFAGYGLGYKRNYARITALALAGLWLALCVFSEWVILRNSQGLLQSADIGLRMFGITINNNALIVFTSVLTFIIGMQIYTIATLLQPRIIELFKKSATNTEGGAYHD